MSNFILKSAWKEKIDIINIFDEKFLNEKDIALQPISFILDINNNLNNDNLNKNPPLSKNSTLTKNKKEEKDKSPKITKKNTSKRKSLKNSGLYNSNIIIVQSITDEDGDDDSSFNQIEKEVEKIKRMMTKSKSKKNKKRLSKPKGLKGSNSAKF